MEALLDRLSSGQIVAVISVISGSIVGLAMIYAITKYQLQALADETALKREQHQAHTAFRQKLLERSDKTGATLDELLALEGTALATDTEALNAELAKTLGGLDASGELIGMAVAQVMALEPDRKRIVLSTVQHMISADAEHDAILNAALGLCDPRNTPAVA